MEEVFAADADILATVALGTEHRKKNKRRTLYIPLKGGLKVSHGNHGKHRKGLNIERRGRRGKGVDDC